MPTIQQSIRLYDGMTPVLHNIINAMNMMVSTFEQAQRNLSQPIDTSALRYTNDQLAQAGAGLNQIEQNIQQNTNRQNQFNRTVQSGGGEIDRLSKKIMGMVGAYTSIQGVGKVLNLSDQMSQTHARLSLIVDDGGSVEALEQQIFASAQRARASYTDTLQNVSKLGLLAGDAFSGTDEMVYFSELMSKNFKIAGASASDQTNAMYQLNQAMASGRLQGDEYRTITENAPLLAQSIEDYMRNVQKAEGSMKDWASQGLLTADVIKTALFESADDIEKRFENMPVTFAEVWTDIKNNAVLSFQPIFDRLSATANSADFKNMIAGVTNALATVAGVVLNVFDIVGQVAGFIADNWAFIGPVVLGVAAALGVYYGAQMLANGVSLVSKGIHVAMAAAQMIHLAVTNGLTAATAAETATQWGLNTAMYACPITWIIIGIIALISVTYLVVGAINHFANTSISATGVICGAFMWLGAAIGNVFISLWNIVAPIFVGIYNVVADVANFFANVFDDPVNAIKGLFFDLFDSNLGVLQTFAQALDDIFGSNLAHTVQGWRDKMSDLSAKVVTERKIVMEKMDPNDLHTDLFDLGVAWDSGYKFGEGIEQSLSNFNMDDLFKMPDFSPDVRDIANNTGDIKDSLEIAEEDLRYMRDIAERDVINRFTTAEVKVDLGGVTNNVSSNTDLDGLVSYLADGTREALEYIRAGV